MDRYVIIVAQLMSRYSGKTVYDIYMMYLEILFNKLFKNLLTLGLLML